MSNKKTELNFNLPTIVQSHSDLGLAAYWRFTIDFRLGVTSRIRINQ